MRAPPLSLYVHLPWCVRKCPYCDFNSHAAGDDPPKRRYIDALIADIGNEAQHAADRELVSVFLGGGTPSLFSPVEIGEILDAVDEHYVLAENIEVTMEANPGTVECGDPAGYRTAGVTRLSIGAQSFSASQLETLGRIHSVDDIARAVDEAHAAGFDNINLDLMHSLPGQTVETALADLESAIALGPQHISWYQLTLEPNTVFYARPPEGIPDNDLAWEIQEAGQSLLDANDFEQYEISAYARDGRRCAHNMNYWSFGDYLAVGAGAHGKLTTADGIIRYAKPANPRTYMETAGQGVPLSLMARLRCALLRSKGTPRPAVPSQRQLLTESDLVFEYMLNALRLTDGFVENDFEVRTGLPADRLASRATGAIEKGLIERNEAGRWRPTALGWRFLNDLQAEFLPEKAA